MIADLASQETLFVESNSVAKALAAEGAKPTILHEYGRVRIAESQSIPRAAALAPMSEASQAEGPTERLGSEAFSIRNSDAFAAAKEARPYAGLSWGAEGVKDGPTPIHSDVSAPEVTEPPSPSAIAGGAKAGTPLSARMKGRITVGVVLVSGSAPRLALSSSEQTKVVAEVQHGLSFLAGRAPQGDVTFVHSVEVRTVSAPEAAPGSSLPQCEAPWRDEVLKQMGYAAGLAGCRAYAEDLRRSLKTNWAYVAFFTKYRLGHFAYASMGGPRLVMHYENDKWGVDNIDRMFAHETGHIFNAPDEYRTAGCSCDGRWGHYGKPNSNCETCAAGGGVDCIMRGNSWAMCDMTPYHLGYEGLKAAAAPAGV